MTVFVFEKTTKDDVGLNEDGAVDVETHKKTQDLEEAGLIGYRRWLDGDVEIGWM